MKLQFVEEFLSSSIKDGLITNEINKVYGIFNGTTNFILSSMDFDKLNFESALKKAQSLGYAKEIPKQT